MTETLLTATLALGTLGLIGGALRATWQRYGRLALAVPGQLAACPPTRTVRYAVRVTGGARGGTVVALPVRPAAALRPAPHGLRAAA